jgi:hypothetical protein
MGELSICAIGPSARTLEGAGIFLASPLIPLG